MFKYEFGAPVWRIRIDTVADRLAVEVRDADVLQARFYTYSRAQQTLAELALPQQLSWWQGLEDAHGGYVYLHGYGDRKLGQHKGITALAAATGQLVWEQPELTFYGTVAAGTVAYNVADAVPAFSILAAATGHITTDGLNQQAAAEAVANYGQQRYAACTYPVLYLQGEIYFEQVQEFLSATVGAIPVKAIEYAETAVCIVVSYYQLSEEKTLDNMLAVFDFEGNLLLKTALGVSLNGIGSDTFLIFGGELYFTQYRSTLCVYSLLQ